MTRPKLGLIGAGLVGIALAERLQQAGNAVLGFDIDSHRRDALLALTGNVAANADDVASMVDVIMLSLPTSKIAAEVIATITTPLAGKTIIDTTTGEPSEMVALGHSLAARGAQYLDATIAGSSAQVRSGEVIVMVGGDSDVVSRFIPLLQTFSVRVFHVGPWGAGARMKLVVNLVLGLNRAVLAEALCFAERIGVDPRQAFDVLRSGPAFSKVMEIKGEKMLNGEFAPQARLAQHLKDVRLILSAGEAVQADLPLSTLHEQLLSQLDSDGFGDLDNSAIIKAFRGNPSP
jgi:3-hydroxyisobutyrate dehydrogenase-like beta-hydroxyacid dehydrogenase